MTDRRRQGKLEAEGKEEMNLHHTKKEVRNSRDATEPNGWPRWICEDWLELMAEVEELQAIIAKLPRTADGVPVVPGMTLFLLSGSGAIIPTHAKMYTDYEKEYFSTREAAEAAT